MPAKTNYISLSDKKELWSKIHVDDWASFLNSENPQGDWFARNGKTIVGKSPVKDGKDSTPSFFIKPQRGFAHCFATSTTILDPIEFIADYITDENYMSAVDTIQKTFDLKLKSAQTTNFKRTYELQQFKKQLVEISNQFLYEAAFTGKDGIHDCCDDAIAYLEDRASVDIVKDSLIGAWPSKHYIWNNLDVDPELDVNRMKNLIGKYARDFVAQTPHKPGHYGGWLTMPYFQSPDTVGRIKLIKPDPNDKQQRYLGFPQELKDKDNVVEENDQGFFGLDMFSGYDIQLPDHPDKDDAGDNPNNVYVVEGEFDQIALAEKQLSQAYPDFIVVAGGGSGVNKADYLSFCGFDNISIIPDNDEGGEEFVKHLLSRSDNSKFDRMEVFEWPDSLPDKDPDETVQRMGADKAIQQFSTEDQYAIPEAWARRRIIKKCKNLDEISAKRSIVMDYKDVVTSDDGDDFVSNEFLARVSEAIDISVDTLKKSFASISTQRGYKAAILRQLENIAEPVANKDGDALVYSYKTDETIEINKVQSNKTIQTLTDSMFDQGHYSWLCEHIGEPDWLRFHDDDNSEKRSLELREDKAKKFLLSAFRDFSAKAPMYKRYKTLDQGVHWVDASRDSLDRDMLDEEIPDQRVYVVNGHRVYRGVYHDQTNKMHYKELEIPRDGRYIFELDREKRWSEAISGVKALNSSPDHDPEDVFNKVREIINTGWRFKKQRLQCTFLAAHLMTLTISMMFDKIMLTLFNAPSQSGKSKFVKGVVGGKGDARDLNLVEHSYGVDNYSAAGIIQERKSSSLTIALDEFEDEPYRSDKSGNETSKILDNVRAMSGKEGAKVVRGTSHGESRESTYRFPIFAAAINPIREEQNFNRWNTIRLQRVEGLDAPQVSIPRECGGQQKIEEMRKAITLLPLKSLWEIKKANEEVKREVLSENKINYSQDRFMRRLIPVLSVLKWLGQNYLDFGQRYINHFESMMDEEVTTRSEEMFRTIFNTPSCRIPGTNDRINPVKMLNDSSKQASISETNSGIYYLQETPYVLIDTHQVAQNTLSNMSTYQQAPPPKHVYKQLREHPKIKGNITEIEEDHHRTRLMQHAQVEGVTKFNEILYMELDDITADDAPEQSPAEGMEELHEEPESGDNM